MESARCTEVSPFRGSGPARRSCSWSRPFAEKEQNHNVLCRKWWPWPCPGHGMQSPTAPGAAPGAPPLPAIPSGPEQRCSWQLLNNEGEGSRCQTPRGHSVCVHTHGSAKQSPKTPGVPLWDPHASPCGHSSLAHLASPAQRWSSEEDVLLFTSPSTAACPSRCHFGEKKGKNRGWERAEPLLPLAEAPGRAVLCSPGAAEPPGSSSSAGAPEELSRSPDSQQGSLQAPGLG